MSEILILTGPCGVGKSTIARAWAKEREGAIVDADYFTEWVFNDILEKFSWEEQQMVAELSFLVAKEYLNRGMSVAIEMVWTPRGLEYLRQRFQSLDLPCSLKLVRLKCDLVENHRRDEQRIPEDQMKERVDIVNEELDGYLWGPYVQLIDTTDWSVEQTLMEINKLEVLN